MSHELPPRVRSESPLQTVSVRCETDNLRIKEIHIRIKIPFVCDGLPILALQAVFELTRIRCDLLMRDRGLESAVQEIVCNLADRPPVRAVLARSVRKGMHLKSKLVHNPLHRLTIDLMPKIAQLCP